MGRYLRTVRQLRPEQVAHRLRLRSQKLVLSRYPALGERLARPMPDTWGWPEDFVPLDGRMPADPAVAEAIAEGRFTFLNQERALGTPYDWQQAEAEQLWRYNLHYFEWAWHLAGHPDREWAANAFEGLFRSWQSANPVGRWDAWSPYVTSLRAWALCGVHEAVVAGRPVEDDVVQSLARHAGYLRWHLEHDVGGNHLVKNLKGLLGLATFLGDERLLRQARAGLIQQVQTQVLTDGGHYERAPSYHAQVLADLLDCGDLLQASGTFNDFESVTEEMRAWLEAILLPDGDIPVFNDGAVLGVERVHAMGVRPRITPAMTLLEPSGFVVLRPSARLHLVIDVGPPCPADLPAHAHADSLSFVLSVDGERVIVDTGTSTYQHRTRRQVERSTAAHNTIEVDDADSTEVWGSFRAGRRATTTFQTYEEVDGTLIVTCSHDGYRFLSGKPTVARRFEAHSDRISIVDEITGSGRHRITSRLHIAPGALVSAAGDRMHEAGDIQISNSHHTVAEPCLVATHFGKLEPNVCLVTSMTDDLPQTMVMSISLR